MGAPRLSTMLCLSRVTLVGAILPLPSAPAVSVLLVLVSCLPSAPYYFGLGFTLSPIFFYVASNLSRSSSVYSFDGSALSARLIVASSAYTALFISSVVSLASSLLATSTLPPNHSKTSYLMVVVPVVAPPAVPPGGVRGPAMVAEQESGSLPLWHYSTL